MNKEPREQDRKRAKPPIVDGWIELAPGEKILIDERLSKDWHQHGKEIKELRGRILAVFIQIELTLDSLLRHLFFPEHFLKIDQTKTDLKISDLSSLFLYEVIKDLSFNVKYKIFKKLSMRHNLLEGKDCTMLLVNLDKVRKVRNLFAHSAISFVPVGNSPDQILRPEGYSEGKRIVLDQEYIANCEKLFSQVIKSLEVLNRDIAKTKQNEK